MKTLENPEQTIVKVQIICKECDAIKNTPIEDHNRRIKADEKLKGAVIQAVLLEQERLSRD